MVQKARRFALFALAASVAMACAGCAAPTLPLPPPLLPSVAHSDAAGIVHLTSDRGALPNALVVIYNRNPAVALDKRVSGSQADANGSWDADVVAKAGDQLDITQEVETERSPPITVLVR